MARLLARARILLDRPIRDDHRRRLATTCVALIAAGAIIALLAAPRDPGTRPRAGRPPAAQRPTTTPGPVTPAPATSAPEEVSEERSAGPHVTRREVARAKRAAARFLRGYLAYTHGRAPASRISAVTPELRRQLTAAAPRVPARERRRRARIDTLQTAGVAADRIGALALVDDGKRRYTVQLSLVRSRGRWQVTQLGGR